MPSRQREREVQRQRRLRQEQRRQEARRRARRRQAILGSVLAAALVVGLAALLFHPGGKKNSTATASPTPTPSAAATASPFPPLAAGTDRRLATKPVVRVPRAAPTRLIVRDLVVGTGAAARPGRELTVNYVGVGYPKGTEFDSSWQRRAPFTFVLGKGKVVRGWDQGLVGMRAGGRRELVIPASLAYGGSGQPPAIGPNEPLVFVVDLLSVT